MAPIGSFPGPFKGPFIAPFKGTHYQPQLRLNDLIIPPYDTLTESERNRYKSKSPYNFSHVDLPGTKGTDFALSAQTLRNWKEKGITRESARPCYYLYRQNFEAFGRKHQRDTLLCAVGLEEFSTQRIRPHENTFGKYKAERLELLKTTRCNLSHIFGMVKDPEGFLETQFEDWAFEQPLLQAQDDEGVSHTVWQIEADQSLSISSFFEERPIYIVDGHHRYESALMFAKEQGVLGKWNHPAALTTFCIANVFDPGLIIYPTHRHLKKGSLKAPLKHQKLEEVFVVKPISFDLAQNYVQTHCPTPSFILFYQGELLLLTPRVLSEEEPGLKALAPLGVIWSDRYFFELFCGVTNENRGSLISYEKSFESAWNNRNESELVVFQAPPAVQQVTDVADAGLFMPQKSTYFIPKLAGGLVFRDLGA